jgi:hypothetical protein
MFAGRQLSSGRGANVSTGQLNTAPDRLRWINAWSIEAQPTANELYEQVPPLQEMRSTPRLERSTSGTVMEPSAFW